MDNELDAYEAYRQYDKHLYDVGRIARMVGAARGYDPRNLERPRSYSASGKDITVIMSDWMSDDDSTVTRVNITEKHLSMTLEEIIEFEAARGPQFEWVEAGRTYHLMTIEEWKDSVDDGIFIDYDGSGDYIKFIDGVMYEWSPTSDWTHDITPLAYPSDGVKFAPEGATHVNWANR